MLFRLSICKQNFNLNNNHNNANVQFGRPFLRYFTTKSTPTETTIDSNLTPKKRKLSPCMQVRQYNRSRDYLLKKLFTGIDIEPNNIPQLYEKIKTQERFSLNDSFNFLIMSCEDNVEKADQFYGGMKNQNIQPDVNTFHSLIKVSEKSGNLDIAEQYYEQMKNQNIEPTLSTFNSLIKVSEKSGNKEKVEQYQNYFKISLEKINKDKQINK